MSNNELYEHKRSDTVKWVLTLFAFILVGVMLAGVILGWFDKKEEPPAEEEQTEQAAVTDGEGNAMDADMVYPMPAKMSFNAQTFAQFGEPNAVTSEQSVDVRIQAYVTPDDAANKEVDFSVVWGNAPTHGSEPVTNYLTVTPDSDGSTMATVSCKKAFGDDTIIITVTTREGGYTATCTVTFTGIASGIEITSSTAAKKSTSERGEYYELGTSKTYTFNIGLTNAFDDVASDLTVTEIGGEASANLRISSSLRQRFRGRRSLSRRVQAFWRTIIPNTPTMNGIITTRRTPSSSSWTIIGTSKARRIRSITIIPSTTRKTSARATSM